MVASELTRKTCHAIVSIGLYVVVKILLNKNLTINFNVLILMVSTYQERLLPCINFQVLPP